MSDAVFFIHGGPGFNSIPEREVLGPLLSARGIDAYFWNEPSPFRDRAAIAAKPQTFPHWLASLDEEFARFADRRSKVHLIGFSFGTHGAIFLSQKYRSRISGMTLVSPSIDLHSVFKNICGLSVTDFEIKAPEKSSKIQSLLDQSAAVMDPPMERAFQLALENELLLTHYWHDPARMQEWVKWTSAPEARFDLNSFFEVSRTFTLSHLRDVAPPENDFPVQLVFGEFDPIVANRASEAALARTLFKHVRELTLRGTGHFPHLERTSEFIGKLTESL